MRRQPSASRTAQALQQGPGNVSATSPSDRRRARFEVHGVVQGVGFRPFVYATASELGLCGFVANTGAGVAIEVEGSSDAVADFGRRLGAEAPPLAVILGILESARSTRGDTAFNIEASSAGEDQVRTLAPADVATCNQCLAEMADPHNRRYRHPFISCTNCGPRYTIILDLPYDRAATTMATFDMCQACRAEYEDPADRRFHAQPIACPDCGPVLTLVSKETGSIAGGDALTGARAALSAGAILAVKGIGGYHLACDADNTAAVAELRARKERGGKPFAVMVADIGAARALVNMSEREQELLSGHRRPIVLLPPADSERACHLAAAVAPGNPAIGVMLAYTPLHTLLFGLPGDPPGPTALVMTSGNAAGEPIVTDDEQARQRLAPFADAWLSHDRRIHVPCDDSVTRIAVGAELPVRRARGYAPHPIALPFEVGPMLAVGADLKNACALASGRYAWLSQHLGDLDDVSTLDGLTRVEGHLELLTGIEPQLLITDQHPGYRSAQWARNMASGRPIRRVQHHHAHIASVMGEHGLGPDEQVIGFAFDGTGYGSDGAVWGGEVLVATYKSFRRAAHLRYVPLAGGDASVLRPYRMALAHLRSAGVPWEAKLPPLRACPDLERDLLAHQFTTGFGCVPTSSMGRLFDAVASLAGIRQTVTYEGEAAVELEDLAACGIDAGTTASAPYRFDLQHSGTHSPVVADPGPMIAQIAGEVLDGMPLPAIAASFHDAVTTLIVDLAQICRAQSGLGTVALGGGVFQNTLLVAAAQEALSNNGFEVLLPRALPANDGGIAFGQILVGASI
jgi:hydrogenase maturation protein HypF